MTLPPHIVSVSLSAGDGHDLCSDAAVGDGAACAALPGAFHVGDLRRGGLAQRRDETVLDRNELRGERNK